MTAPRAWQVLLPLPLPAFSFLPPHGVDAPPVGARVVVPWSGSVRVGILVGLEPLRAGASLELREAVGVLEAEPFLDEASLQTVMRVATYTCAPAGMVLANLLPTGLNAALEHRVRALGVIGELLGARGRVLPMADVPLELVATVASVDPDDPARSRRIRGQVAIASTPGRVQQIQVSPADPPVPAAALEAIAAADVVSLGPGSWYTSVLPHLLVPRRRAHLRRP